MSETKNGAGESRRTIVKKDSSGEEIGKITVGPNRKKLVDGCKDYL